MQILKARRQQEIKRIMQDIGVDPWGIKIMLPKAMHYLVRINALSNIAANILKQEMLSLGGDAAVSRDSLKGGRKTTDSLIIGNLSQLDRLSVKLRKQPFGLDKIASQFSPILKNYQTDRFALDLGKYRLNLGSRAYLMGILNLTPDSFSGDGLYRTKGTRPEVSSIVDRVQKMVEDGADIIDVGGESSRPQAKPVPLGEEISRTIPVIKALAKKVKVPISIDTCKPEVAKRALENGAVIINDITALRSPGMAKLAARHKACVVLMHMKGNPRTMQRNPRYTSLIEEIIEYLDRAVERAESAGIAKEKIIVDPGIGFGKQADHNLQILKRLEEFKVLGKPILVGTSRKSFIGHVLNAAPSERIFGTVSSCILALNNGAKILRVHDVREVKQALKIYQSVEDK